MHCLQKTVAFYSETVLSRYYDTPQLRAVQTLLMALGDALLKHGCAKPLVKPFANENVQGVDLQTFYVKNPLKKLILLLHADELINLQTLVTTTTEAISQFYVTGVVFPAGSTFDVAAMTATLEECMATTDAPDASSDTGDVPS